MEGIVKIAVAGVAGAIIALVLKKDIPELALAATLAVVMVLIYLLMDAVGQVLAFVKDMASMAEMSDGMLAPVLKCVGIAVITKIAADICRDARETAVASAIELAGVVVSLFLMLPLLRAVVKLIISFL